MVLEVMTRNNRYVVNDSLDHFPTTENFSVLFSSRGTVVWLTLNFTLYSLDGLTVFTVTAASKFSEQIPYERPSQI